MVYEIVYENWMGFIEVLVKMGVDIVVYLCGF